MRRSIDDGRFSAWTFVAPVILVVAVVIVVGVARPIFSEVRNAASNTTSIASTAKVTVRSEAVGSTSVATTAAKTNKWDTVRQGDTLGQIAARNGTTVAKIRKLNPAIDPQALQLNQRVRVRR
jgi:membrane-bound lytic murein transglycosylase D